MSASTRPAFSSCRSQFVNVMPSTESAASPAGASAAVAARGTARATRADDDRVLASGRDEAGPRARGREGAGGHGCGARGGAYEARVSRDASGRKTTRGEDCADGAGSEVDRLYRRILPGQPEPQTVALTI